MSRLRRLVLVRHGESEGNSHERLIGAGDPALAPLGREQMREARGRLAGQVLDLVVASPLRRAWQSARELLGDVPLRLEPDFREIDFGRWEGLTLDEVKASDPVRWERWQAGAPDFEYPNGEARAAFRERVERGLAGIEASGASSALVVAHKGVVRHLVEKRTGETLERERPHLGEVLILTRRGDQWFLGQRSTNPPGVGAGAT